MQYELSGFDWRVGEVWSVPSGHYVVVGYDRDAGELLEYQEDAVEPVKPLGYIDLSRVECDDGGVPPVKYL